MQALELMSNSDVIDAIEARVSTRTFPDIPIVAADVEKIATYINNPDNLVGPFGNQQAFELVIENEKNEKQRIGTYGVISHAQGYILGSSTTDTESLFDYAYVMENIVLYLTSIGIGTCWLGGRFRKQEAMSHIVLGEDEVIPAITPIGYFSEKKSLKERLMRTVLRANKRKAAEQLFFYENFNQPLADRAREFEQALHLVRIAPSAQNKQPWRLVFNKDFSQVHFYFVSGLSHNKLYMCEPEYLDIAIAYRHFEIGLHEVGIMGHLAMNEPHIDMPKYHRYITTWYRD